MVTRRPMQWYTVHRDFATLAALATTNTTLYSASVLGARNVIGATITRMIIDIGMRNDSLAQLNTLHWGIVIMNADARAAGAFPDPADETDRPDWLVRSRLQGNADSLSDSSQWNRIRMDLRAQRKFRSEEDELQLICKNSSAAFVNSWTMYIRTLVRLP